jgi:hypothetical protein
MRLEGSCYCKAVRFSVNSDHPYPFMRCYCSICRKTAGSGGYAINLNADFDSLEIVGAKNIRKFHARATDPETGLETESPAERSFCGNCGSALWLWDPRWPKQVHPQASVIDTELPVPPEHTHIMLGSKPGWVEPDLSPKDKEFSDYPQESIADWHRRISEEVKT